MRKIVFISVDKLSLNLRARRTGRSKEKGLLETNTSNNLADDTGARNSL